MDIYPASEIPFALPTVLLRQHVLDWGTLGVGIGVLAVGVVLMIIALRFLSDDMGDRGLVRTLRFHIDHWFVYRSVDCYGALGAIHTVG